MPEWRRTTNTNSLVANFKIASTARRLDRESGRWIDGNSLRVRVTCWRKLAEGVAASIMVGDPVVAVGRLYTRDWTDADGNARVAYEMEAVAVGHDLARGKARFQRNRPALTTSTVEDEEADLSVRGEATSPVSREDVPGRPGDGLFADDPEFADIPPMVPTGFDAVAVAGGGDGFDTGDGPRFATTAEAEAEADGVADSGAGAEELSPFDDSADVVESLEEQFRGTEADSTESAPRSPRSRRRTPVPA